MVEFSGRRRRLCLGWHAERVFVEADADRIICGWSDEWRIARRDIGQCAAVQPCQRNGDALLNLFINNIGDAQRNRIPGQGWINHGGTGVYAGTGDKEVGMIERAAFMVDH
ncbi:hypothetical protein D3C81_560450 [compost metagenome]